MRESRVRNFHLGAGRFIGPAIVRGKHEDVSPYDRDPAAAIDARGDEDRFEPRNPDEKES